jgi:hypothetical protein
MPQLFFIFRFANWYPWYILTFNSLAEKRWDRDCGTTDAS